MSSEQSLLREIVLALVLPLVKLSRTYEYTVRSVAADGRCELVPTRSKIAPKLPSVPQWGPSGTRAQPRIGSTVAVQFLDGDAGRPIVSSFVPLSTQVGQPALVEIDADSIVLAQGELPVGRGGAKFKLTGGATMTLTITDPDGVEYQWAITGSNSGGPVTFVVVPDGDVGVDGEAVIDPGRAEVLV